MLNNIVVMGYLVADPDLRMTPAGKSVCRFSIGNTRPTKDREVDFLDIVTFNHTAEFVNKYFKKGNPIVISGRLQTQHLVDTKDGRSTKIYEIVANSADFVPKTKAKEKTDDDLPFNI